MVGVVGGVERGCGSYIGGRISCLRATVDSVGEFGWNKLKLDCRLALRVGEYGLYYETSR